MVCFFSAGGPENIFSQQMLLPIWRQHPLCFVDVVSKTERCIFYDGRPFDLKTYRLETEAGSKLTQLGLMARCRQIRQQHVLPESTCEVIFRPESISATRFSALQFFFWGLWSNDSTAGPIGRQGLKRMRCTSINTAICRSRTLHLQNFVHVFFDFRVAKQSSGAKPPPVPKIITCSWRIFSANKRTQSTTTESHKCLKMHFWKHLQLFRQCWAVHSQINDSGSLNDTYWNLKMNFTFTGSVDRCFSCLGFRFWRKTSQGHWIFAVHWSCNVSLHVVFMATWVILQCQNG